MADLTERLTDLRVALIGIYEGLRLLQEHLFEHAVSMTAMLAGLKERDPQFAKLYEKHFRALAVGPLAHSKDAAVATIDQAIAILKSGLN